MLNDMVSVLMPVFNREEFVSQAIESILGQSYQNVQLIIYDDGSTDNTPKILREFSKKDARIVLILGSHIGIPAARNVLLNNCKTRYACWQDSDDVANISRVEFLLKAIKRYGDQYIVSSGGAWIGKDDLPDWRQTPEVLGVGELISSKYTCNKTIRNWFATIMFCTENILRFKCEIVFGGEDSCWLKDIRATGRKFVIIPSKLYYRRNHPDEICIVKREIVRVFTREEIIGHSYKEMHEMLRKNK
jgi:glycosyltransferase involved in cell wall biosynthesis